MDGLGKELQYALVTSTRDIYEKYIQKALNQNNNQLVLNILEKIVIPDKALYWMASRDNSNIELMKKMFTYKRQCDIFIEQLEYIFQRECVLHLTIYRLHELIKRHFPVINHYFRAFLEKLLINNDNYLLIDHYSKSYPASNISKNYRNIDWSIDKAVCEAVYFTQYEFLENLYRVIGRNNIHYKLDIKLNEEHKQLIKWLEDNISKGRSGQPMGWSCGPDSGNWPSTTLEDYVKTLEVVRLYFL